jgi:hypothetical protein
MMYKKPVDKNLLPRHLRNAPGGKFDYLKEAYRPEPDSNAQKHLGMMNDWGADKKNWPKPYRHCQLRKRKRMHDPTAEKKGKCLTEYSCATCKIAWTADSSD